ncbi:MAG TPA: DNA topoisomerase I, partial [Alphaproteobacteria bacterium]|nr:DNA topoisomerase I [Alphaproteobacteria bacterium]
LMLALKSVGQFKIMSSGRVQGPSLKTIVDLEKEIAKFKPTPFWEIQVNGQLAGTAVESWHKEGQFTDEKEVKKIVHKVDGKNGTVKSIDKSEFIQKAPVPFDLTTLQTEAYRFFGIPPKQTLEIAQQLYTGGYISYPRTSSQKLPKEIGYKKIMESLGKSNAYKFLALDLLKLKELVPTEGKKTDPAHPAIYPTGTVPNVKDRVHKVYDLIVKRFFSCFAEDAKRETVTITIEIEKEPFIAKGTRTTFAGWHKFYEPYVKLEDQEMPSVKQGDKFTNKETIKHDKQTQPPRRYTQASLIRELENRNLGTKATRAAIIDSLYNRNYIKNDPIEATELGMETVIVLDKYIPEINDEALTRHFEEEMEEIREKKLGEHKVLEEAEHELTKLLAKFKKHEQEIGKELLVSYKKALETQSNIGPCPVCHKGTLRVTYSKASKRKFIGCDKYPDCKTIVNMPFGGFKKTDKTCEECQYPILLVFRGKRPQQVCINTDCPSKHSKDPETIKEIKDFTSGKLKKKCPTCGKDLILRTSLYGQFLACPGYPDCRYIESLNKTGKDGKVIKGRGFANTGKAPTKTAAKKVTAKQVVGQIVDTSKGDSDKKKTKTAKKSEEIIVAETKEEKPAKKAVVKKATTKKSKK